MVSFMNSLKKTTIFFNFDEDILNDIVKEKIPEDQIPKEFTKRKKALNHSWKKLVNQEKGSSTVITRKELEKQIGL
jgi:hypothetical protein